MTNLATKLTEKDEALNSLRSMLKPGDKIYTILRHVSNSGMSRRISCFIIKGKDAGPYCIDWHIEKLGLYNRHKKHEGLVVGGCGMDMGFAVVYNLSSKLFPKGFKLAKGQYGRNGDKSGYDNNGGYALKQVWL